SAIIIDTEGLYADELLAAYLPGYSWQHRDELGEAETEINAGEIDLALEIDGLTYRVYEKTSSIASVNDNMSIIPVMVQDVYRQNTLVAAGVDPEAAVAIMSSVAVGEYVTVGKDYLQGYILAYALVMLVYITTVLYGQQILTSVVTEKSSKAMELLITSAKPLNLMFGKVIGTGCAGLTQFGALMLTAAIVLGVNLQGWTEFSPLVGGIITSTFSAGLFVYAVVFFLLGFFAFAFLYAAMGSTVSRMEDASSTATLPMLLVMVTFFVSISALMAPEALYVRICSFVPFLSPLVMFVRMCMSEVPVYQTVIAIVANCFYVFGSGWVSAKIYRVGVMMYGKPPKFRDIIRYIRQS
ncbi:MAG: ABC transporter permease, partial [Oscillospiraceae bacterium]|nr:ABC transporter permease [Oscillospiraceae bacterium]